MDNLGLYLKIAGIAIGAIGLFFLIRTQPWIVAAEVFGATTYFVGQFLSK